MLIRATGFQRMANNLVAQVLVLSPVKADGSSDATYMSFYWNGVAWERFAGQGDSPDLLSGYPVASVATIA